MIGDLCFYGCSSLLPPELAGKDADSNKVLAFLREKEKAESTGSLKRMAMAKVMVTGPGSAGKTCLIHRLKSSSFLSDSMQTNGLDVTTTTNSAGVDFMFYDFGGQAVYSSTHRLFLRSRAVFLVAWNPRTDASYHNYARDVLNANDDAPLIFVSTHADDSNSALTSQALEVLKSSYGSNFRGYVHVSAKTGAGMDDLSKLLDTTADSLDHMHDEVPGSYHKLRDDLQSMSSLFLSGEEWKAAAVAAGVSEAGASVTLDLFHAWGAVLKLPSLSYGVSGGDDDDILPPVILKPQQLAEVLAQVITADKDCVANSRQGILRHSELSQVWKKYDAQLHSGFLHIIHESGLGFPIQFDDADGGDLSASLIPAMLKASEGSAMDVVREMHVQHAGLAKQGTVRVTLASLPHQLALQLQVGLRSLAVLGGWWNGGSALAVKTSDGKVSAIGHFTYSLEKSTLEVACFGSLVLRNRVLNTFKRIRDANYEGVEFEEVELVCQHEPKDRVFSVDEITEAADEGKSCVKCKKCGYEHAIFDLVFWFKGKVPGVALPPPAAPVPMPASAQKPEPSRAPPVASRRGSFQSTFGSDPSLLRLQQKLAASTPDADDVQYSVLESLEKLQGIFANESTAGRCKGIWLVFEASSNKRLAYSLRPRLDADFVLDEAHSVDVTGQEEAQHKAGSTVQVMEEVFQNVVNILDITPEIIPSKFVSLLWSCSDSVRSEIKRAVKSFRHIEHPETGKIWVHPHDYQSFTFSIALAVSKQAASDVLSQVKSIATEVQEVNRGGFENLSAAIGSVDRNQHAIMSGQDQLRQQGDRVAASVSSMAEGQRRLENGQAQLLEGQAQILNMSAATMSLVESSTSKLCTAIFEATEVATPTCFVILPYKLPMHGAAVSEEEKRSMLDKAEGWLGTVIGLVEEGTKIIDNPVKYAKSFFGGAFKKKITEVKEKMVEKTLFLYLVDEFTHQPVCEKSGVYPIEIETKSELVDKYMPMMRVGLQAILVANGAAALANVFFPIVPRKLVPASLVAKAKGFVDGLDKDSSAADYSSVQDQVDGEGGGGAKRGGELRDFEKFLKKHDEGREFGGLRRVCDKKDGTAIWVSEDSAKSIEEAGNAPPGSGNAPRANVEEAAAAPDAPISSVAGLLKAAGCLDKKDVFDHEKIDMEAILELDNADLKELGLAMGERKKLLHIIQTRAAR